MLKGPDRRHIRELAACHFQTGCLDRRHIMQLAASHFQTGCPDGRHIRQLAASHFQTGCPDGRNIRQLAASHFQTGCPDGRRTGGLAASRSRTRISKNFPTTIWIIIVEWSRQNRTRIMEIFLNFWSKVWLSLTIVTNTLNDAIVQWKNSKLQKIINDAF